MMLFSEIIDVDRKNDTKKWMFYAKRERLKTEILDNS